MMVPSSYTESTRHTDYDDIKFPKFTEKKIQKVFGSPPEPIIKSKSPEPILKSKYTNKNSSRNSIMGSYIVNKPKYHHKGRQQRVYTHTYASVSLPKIVLQ